MTSHVLARNDKPKLAKDIDQRVGRRTMIGKALPSMTRIGRLLAAVIGWGAVAAGSALPARATDVTTFGYDLQRTGYNSKESVIGTGNVDTLRLQWSAATGRLRLLTQPLVATGAATAHGKRDLVYVGARSGGVVAVDRATGSVVWKAIGNGKLLGIFGMPALDRARHAVYVATWGDDVHALDEATGAELAGWPVHVTPRSLTDDRVYGGLTFAGGRVYIQISGLGDQPPYRGELIAVDVASHAVVKAWYPEGTKGPSGGGLWGMGGVSLEPDGSAVYAAVGNALGANEHLGYAEHIVRLSPTLRVTAANYPGLTGNDVDFGATPLLYQASGCPPQLAVMNKAGILFVYDRAKIASGPRQRLQLANHALANQGDFIGLPAYSPALRLLYVNNPSDSSSGIYQHGLVALRVGTDCNLSLAWQRAVGGQATATMGYASIPPSVANGVVYAVRSVDSTVYAFDAASGDQLWSSGSAITGGIFAALTVANGQLLIAGVNGTLYAFTPHG